MPVHDWFRDDVGWMSLNRFSALLFASIVCCIKGWVDVFSYIYKAGSCCGQSAQGFELVRLVLGLR